MTTSVKNTILVDRAASSCWPTFLHKISLAYLSSHSNKVGTHQLLYLSGKDEASWPVCSQADQGQSVSCCSPAPAHGSWHPAVHYSVYRWPLIALTAWLWRHNRGINTSKQHNYLFKWKKIWVLFTDEELHMHCIVSVKVLKNWALMLCLQIVK